MKIRRPAPSPDPVRDPPPHPVLGRWLGSVVVVHTIEDHSVRGVLTLLGHDGLILGAAQYLDGPEPVELTGDTYISSTKVALIQRPEPGAAGFVSVRTQASDRPAVVPVGNGSGLADPHGLIP